MEKKTFDALSKRLRQLFPLDEVMTTPVQTALLRLMLSELRPPRPKPEERASAPICRAG
jgi:hypothetical protein